MTVAVLAALAIAVVAGGELTAPLALETAAAGASAVAGNDR
jgi:hypothetical protein